MNVLIQLLLITLLNTPQTDFFRSEITSYEFTNQVLGNLTGLESLAPPQTTLFNQETFFQVALDSQDRVLQVAKIKPIPDIAEWYDRTPEHFELQHIFRIRSGSERPPQLLRDFELSDLQPGSYIRCIYNEDSLPMKLQFLQVKNDGSFSEWIPFQLRYFQDERYMPDSLVVSRNVPEFNQGFLFINYVYFENSNQIKEKQLFGLQLEDYQDLITKQRTVNVNPRKIFEDINLVPQPRIFVRCVYEYDDQPGQALEKLIIEHQSRFINEYMVLATHYFDYDSAGLLTSHGVTDERGFPIYEEWFTSEENLVGASISAEELMNNTIPLFQKYENTLLFSRFTRYMPGSYAIDYTIERVEENLFRKVNEAEIPLGFYRVEE